MKNNKKKNMDELLQEFNCVKNPVLKEYIMLHYEVFFDEFKKLTKKYLGKDFAKTYDKYISTIYESYDEEEKKKWTYIKDIILKVYKDDNYRLFKPVLMSVFIYPMKILMLSRLKTKTPVEPCFRFSPARKTGADHGAEASDDFWISDDLYGDLPFR